MWGVDITNGTAAEQAPSPIPLDTGSWFVLGVTLCVFFLPLFVLFPPFPPRRSDALWQTHTKLRVAEDNKDKSSKSKLLGLFTKKAATSTAHGNSKGAKIKSLFVHPVDSLTGIEVTRAKVAPTGIEYDRLYTLAQLKSPFPVSVDGAQNKNSGALTAAKDHKWESITQRQFPLLATVQVELWQPDLDKLKGLNDKNAQSNSEAFLILRFPWRESGFFGLWELFAAKCLRGITAVAEKEILLPVGFPPAEDISAKGYVRNETVRLAGRSGGGNENDGHGEVEALDMSVELPEELRLYLGVSNKLGLFRATPSESEKALMEVSTSTNRKRLLGTGKEKPTSYVPIIVGFRDSVSFRFTADCLD